MVALLNRIKSGDLLLFGSRFFVTALGSKRLYKKFAVKSYYLSAFDAR